jgi:hypothetical protein
MNKIDAKLICSLLSSSDILRYISIKDKAELSSCCKFIYEKTIRLRLGNLCFEDSEFQEYINNTQKGTLWTDESYDLKLEYFDVTINKYKAYLSKLVYSGLDYSLLEYFSHKFKNLSSLCLHSINLPKNSLKIVIENLHNLHSLTLSEVKAAYSKSECQSFNFKLSNYLKELNWENCTQFELTSSDLSSFKQFSLAPRFMNESTLDISLNLINSLKSIYWVNSICSNDQKFDELIVNNPSLASLTTTLNLLYSSSYSHIISNVNLTKLTILDFGDTIVYNSQLPKLLNIETLNFYHRFAEIGPYINKLIEDCSNLKELEYHSYYGSDQYLFNYIKNLKKLKILTIIATSYTPSILDSILPQSNIEKFEICTYYPIKFNFKNFVNFKYLKLINNINMLPGSHVWDDTPYYEDLTGWRMIIYAKSTQYWKV